MACVNLFREKDNFYIEFIKFYINVNYETWIDNIMHDLQ